MKHYLRLLRPHHWSKNLLILIPSFAGGFIWKPEVTIMLFIGILLFNLCSSSCYIVNDLLDIENDRKHSRKRFRPIAAGKVPSKHAKIIAISLLFFVLVASACIDLYFLVIIICYFLTSTAYSLCLKKIFLLDIVVLVALYTFRVGAGLILSPAYPTTWLFVFIGTLFLSLAALKRYTEILEQLDKNQASLPGRGYNIKDGGILQITGVFAGLSSAATLLCYTRSDSVKEIYDSPLWLIAIPICLCLWLHRAWMLAKKGHMHYDPIVYAFKDISTYAGGIICITSLFMAY